MNFQNLTNVETAKEYLDQAFRNGQKMALVAKNAGKRKLGSKHISRFDKLKYVELARMQTVNSSLVTSFFNIVKGFPSISELPPFYNELVRTTIDYYQLKKSLGTIGWASERFDRIHNFYVPKIKGSRDFDDLNKHRREFFGRLSSFVYQADKALKFLEYARKTMKEFPSVKTETKTIVIAGFPNVGKTTLLYKLTGSMPEISDYAFTTRGINVSYFKTKRMIESTEEGEEGVKKEEKIQVIDTPGTLNRFNKMNNIEQQAYLAMKYCADIFVYVFDLTEPYPLKDQDKLYKVVHGFEKKIFIYLSKCDILPKEKVDEFLQKHKGAITSPDELKEKVLKELLK